MLLLHFIEFRRGITHKTIDVLYSQILAKAVEIFDLLREKFAVDEWIEAWLFVFQNDEISGADKKSLPAKSRECRFRKNAERYQTINPFANRRCRSYNIIQRGEKGDSHALSSYLSQLFENP